MPNFIKLPTNLYLGEGIGVATNSKGHVFVYTRSGETRLCEFDQNGNFVREIGQGLYGFTFAPAVRVDPQDNIWCVDEGSNMVIKFNPAGRVAMVLGRRPEAVGELSAMSGQGAYSGANKPYSFAENDLFIGTGTTSVAAARWGRNSIGIDVDAHYFKSARRCLSETTAPHVSPLE